LFYNYVHVKRVNNNGINVYIIRQYVYTIYSPMTMSVSCITITCMLSVGRLPDYVKRV